MADRELNLVSEARSIVSLFPLQRMDRVLDHHMEPMTVDIFKFPRQFPGFHFYS